MKSNIFMSLFTCFLAFVRLYDFDFWGFSIFLCFSLLFSYAALLQFKTEKNKSKIIERNDLYKQLAFPKISSRSVGNSNILTFLVPSLKLYNEIKNAQNNEVH